MTGKVIMRLVGAMTCVAAFATTWDAEAGCHRRRCCAPECCPAPACCPAPVYTTSCCAPACAPACETVATYDCCGRLVWRQASCCETIVASSIVVSPPCCGIASTSAASSAAVATARTGEVVKATTTLASK